MNKHRKPRYRIREGSPIWWMARVAQTIMCVAGALLFVGSLIMMLIIGPTLFGSAW